MRESLAQARLGRPPLKMKHAGWAYDAYPDLPTLDAGKTMVVADLEGPAFITTIHMSRHLDPPLPTESRDDWTLDDLRSHGARGVVVEITFDDSPRPSVRVPFADFFGDGGGAVGSFYSTPFVEKSPGSYNCRIPMPFKESARVALHNETEFDLFNYSAVEYLPLPRWEDDLGYFHATWRRWAFQLDADSVEQVFALSGPGALLGQAWTISTDDPFFENMAYVQEGNNRYLVDGQPSVEYLGTEDSFGFAWGFRAPFTGIYTGIPYLSMREPSVVCLYRFRDHDRLSFDRSLELMIDWRHEFRSELFQQRVAPIRPGKQWLPAPKSEGRGWIDFATTAYWYAAEPGHDHDPLPSLNQRCARIMRPNPRG